MQELRLFFYKTIFTNGRSDYFDVVLASNAAEAKEQAELIIRGLSDEYRLDHEATAEVIGEAATEPESIAEIIEEKV